MSDEVRAELMALFMTNFHTFIAEYNITPNNVYNAEQNGMFYQKLPNST